MNQGRWSLPNSWAWSRVGDIATVCGGSTPPSKNPSYFSDNGIPWVTPSDLTGYKKTYISRGARNLSIEGLAKCGAKILPTGSVLFSSRAPIGYCAIAANPIATNQGFKSLTLKEGIVPEFIRYYLISAKDYAESLASGTTFKELSGTKMSELLIPVPPLPEQHRIVAKLDSLLARSRRAREELQRIPKLVERYKKAVLAAAFSGTAIAHNNEDHDSLLSKWDMVPITDIADIVTGRTPPTAQKKRYFGGSIPFIKPTDLDVGYNVNTAREFLTEEGANVARLLPPGTTLVTCIGATIGKTGFSQVHCCTNQQINALVPKIERVKQEWVYWMSISPQFQNQIISNSSATTLPIINWTLAKTGGATPRF